MDDSYNKIEDYLNGELNVQERAAFELSMQSDLALQAEVARQKEMIDRLQAYKLRQTVKKNIRQLPKNGGNGLKINRWMLLIIPIAALVVMFFYFWIQSSPDVKSKPLKTPLRTTPAGVDTVSTEPNKEPISNFPMPDDTPAVEKTKLKKEKAIALTLQDSIVLNALSEMGKIDYQTMGTAQKDTALENRLTYTVLLLLDYQAAKAVDLLEYVVAKKNALYQEDAEWLLALAWWLQEPIKGKAMLEAIEQNPTHAYRSNAIRLLGKLEN